MDDQFSKNIRTLVGFNIVHFCIFVPGKAESWSAFLFLDSPLEI